MTWSPPQERAHSDACGKRCPLSLDALTTSMPMALVNPVGDVAELKAIAAVFARISSPFHPPNPFRPRTGAAGVHEAIIACSCSKQLYSRNGQPEFQRPLKFRSHCWPCELRATQLNQVMSNSFGFGGTNAALIFKNWPINDHSPIFPSPGK